MDLLFFHVTLHLFCKPFPVISTIDMLPFNVQWEDLLGIWYLCVYVLMEMYEMFKCGSHPNGYVVVKN